MLRDDAVTNPKIGALAVDTAELAADAVEGSKIADDQINSEHYVALSIDLEHLNADSVDGTKIADDSINSEHYVDGSIDAQHIASNAITTAKILDENVTAAKIDNRTRYYEVPMAPAPEDITPPTGSQFGWQLDTGEYAALYGGFRVPADFASGGILRFVGFIVTSSGNAIININTNYAALGEPKDTHTTDVADSPVAATDQDLANLYSMTLTGIAAGDYCALNFERNGLSGSDTTLGSLTLVSVTFEYTADS